jgi:hypothetical protein
VGEPTGDEERLALLQRAVDQAPGRVLVLHHPRCREAASTLTADHLELVELGSTVPPGDQAWTAVVLLVPDALALRRAAATLPDGVRTTRVCLWVDVADRALAVVPRPDWPRVVVLMARVLPTGGSLSVLGLAEAMPAGAAVAEFARSVVTSPRVVVEGATLPGLVGPVDESVLNPRGYLRATGEQVAVLQPDGALVADGEQVGRVHLDRGATAVTVAALRGSRGVHVDLARTPAAALTVAGLAMAGVPVTVDPPAPHAGSLLGPDLLAVLEARPDLSDPLRRDEHSVLLRRAAFAEHSTHAARGADHPRVSILLPSKRPHMLRFALRQIAKQTVPAELVLATHGYRTDPGEIRELAGHHAVTVLDLPQDRLFGDVLNHAVAGATGDVLVKMDDDDWYAPDFLADLLLARHCSGAPLVGMMTEFVYLEDLDRTLRRRTESEQDVEFVAGGTMMIDRTLLADLGGFRPVRRFVDAQLLVAALAAGAGIYRTHGLGYVMRRTPGGHTWQAGIDYFLNDKRNGWAGDGFQPSRLLRCAPDEMPQPVLREQNS